MGYVFGWVAKRLRCRMSAPCVALTLAVILGAPALAAASCDGTLNGTYGVNVSGATPGGVSKFITGVLKFKSSCTVTGDIAVGENRVAAPFAPLYAGSYATNADGSITLSLTLQKGAAPEIYAIGYSTAFDEAMGAEMDSSAIATIDIKPQVAPGYAVPASYTNASAQGAFISSCSGNTASFTDLNNFTFDGAGNIVSGVDYYNNYGQSGVEPYAGQYVMNADGTFTGYVIVGGMQYGLTGVIDNGANEVQFVYSANNADITACSAKRVTATPAAYFACHVSYGITTQSDGVFTGAISITNMGNTPLSSWKLSWTYTSGQVLTSATKATLSQKGNVVTLTSRAANAKLDAGANVSKIGISGQWDNQNNTAPSGFAVNGVACN